MYYGDLGEGLKVLLVIGLVCVAFTVMVVVGYPLYLVVTGVMAMQACVGGCI
jgi:F0F1-type ATP synthase assembly protein I